MFDFNQKLRFCQYTIRNSHIHSHGLNSMLQLIANIILFLVISIHAIHNGTPYHSCWIHSRSFNLYIQIQYRYNNLQYYIRTFVCVCIKRIHYDQNIWMLCKSHLKAPPILLLFSIMQTYNTDGNDPHLYLSSTKKKKSRTTQQGL